MHDSASRSFVTPASTYDQRPPAITRISFKTRGLPLLGYDWMCASRSEWCGGRVFAEVAEELKDRERPVMDC
jgi:hypothetical protein